MQEKALREVAIGSWSVLYRGNIINVVAKSNEKIKEELSSAIVHLELHGAAPLEGAAGADDKGEIVSSKLRVSVGCVIVGISRRSQDCAALNSRLKSLLPQRKLLQLLKAIFLGRAVNDSVLQEIAVDATMVDGALEGSSIPFVGGLQLP